MESIGKRKSVGVRILKISVTLVGKVSAGIASILRVKWDSVTATEGCKYNDEKTQCRHCVFGKNK